MSELGCFLIFLKMFKEMHQNTKAWVAFSGELSEVIAVDNEAKQGDLPVLTQFSMYFATILV